MKKNNENLKIETKETRKRKREIFVVFTLIIFFIALSWVEASFFDLGKVFPFAHSVFFFGLVNFNIVLLLFLLFLIFRNLVKVFVERRGGMAGRSLKGKLIAAFIAYSIIPTILMFSLSVFYINSSFEKWFSGQTSDILKTSLEVTNAYYFDTKKKNYHFADQISRKIGKIKKYRQLISEMTTFKEVFNLDILEYYPDYISKRIILTKKGYKAFHIPKVSLELLNKGLKEGAEASSIHQFGKGNLVRVVVPVLGENRNGAVVVSSIVPLSLVEQMNKVTEAYGNYRGASDLKTPLKSIYLIILALMTLVIMFGATWFGIHLARQLSIPLIALGRATKRVATGDYRQIRLETGSEELQQLIQDFNSMVNDLSKWRKEVDDSSYSLKETLKSLDKHSRYIEMVLSNVNTGVISLDTEDRIRTLNHHTCQLLKVHPKEYLGKSVVDLIRDEEGVFAHLLATLNSHSIASLQKEIRVEVDGEIIPLQLTLSNLEDSAGKDIGKIVVFDDLTPVVNAQRAAAWSEVARRIAHEIKNPLTPIKLSAERLQKKFGAEIQDPAFTTCTSMIIEMTENLKTLVNEFNSFARLPQAKPILSSLNSLVKDVVTFYQNSYHERFEFELDADLPKFKFDPDQLKRVLNNLLENAVAVVSSEEKSIRVKTFYRSDLKIVKLSVEDNGIGIAEHEMKRIFEPYFSTKKNGTGLGLAIVKRIIQDHNGFIRAISDRGNTQIVIELPVNGLVEKKTSEMKYDK